MYVFFEDWKLSKWKVNGEFRFELWNKWRISKIAGVKMWRQIKRRGQKFTEGDRLLQCEDRKAKNQLYPSLYHTACCNPTSFLWIILRLIHRSDKGITNIVKIVSPPLRDNRNGSTNLKDILTHTSDYEKPVLNRHDFLKSYNHTLLIRYVTL